MKYSRRSSWTMKNREILYLTLMTVFAVLFLITFFSYKSLKKSYDEMSSELKAYDMFLSGDLEGFLKYVKGKNLRLSKEIDFYLDRFAQLELSAGLSEMESGNYGEALEHFQKVLGMSSISKTTRFRAIMFTGKAFYNLRKYDKAYEYLRVFLEDARDFHGRGEGLVELAKTCIKLGKYDDLNAIKRELRFDKVNLKRIMDLESEME